MLREMFQAVFPDLGAAKKAVKASAIAWLSGPSAGEPCCCETLFPWFGWGPLGQRLPLSTWHSAPGNNALAPCQPCCVLLQAVSLTSSLSLSLALFGTVWVRGESVFRFWCCISVRCCGGWV